MDDDFEPTPAPPVIIEDKTSRERCASAAREASTAPGVYLMKDAEGVVLYVGKAKNLRNRLTTYFRPAPHEHLRIENLVRRINRFEVILTETEAEALILECTLIKKHKPKFNVMLKDDKAYPYIRINLSEAFPRLEWTRKPRRDGARYFGPFPSAWSARQVLQLLNETLALRDCSDNTFRHRSRPCLLYQMGRCSAPCVGKVSGEQYKDSIGQAISVLEGKGDRIIQELRRGMQDASDREEYEQAAFYRDQLANIQLVTETQSVMDVAEQKDRDVVGIARADQDAHAAVLQIRKGKLISAKHFHLQNTDPDVSDLEIITEFLAQFYLGERKKEEKKDADPEHADFYTPVAQEVLLPSAPEDPDLLERTLGLAIRVPGGEPGSVEFEKDTQLVNVARANAKHALELAQKRNAGHGLQALEEVQRKLQLPRLPSRIECYDISNIQGDDAVASRVVFIDGAPDKDLYRRYKIRTVEGANDFAMMREVLGRRFERGLATGGAAGSGPDAFPDLVVVDGGRGQLAQAVSIFEELNIQGIGVVGLAKARTERNFQAKEVASTFERVFIPGRKNPVSLLPHTSAYKLLTHVRDEAHRFAVAYHRKVRSKRTIQGGDSSG
ncbi:MAG: excinuclease ABC subunit UvrC [Bacteriovoracia bacterium]